MYVYILGTTYMYKSIQRGLCRLGLKTRAGHLNNGSQVRSVLLESSANFPQFANAKRYDDIGMSGSSALTLQLQYPLLF